MHGQPHTNYRWGFHHYTNEDIPSTVIHVAAFWCYSTRDFPVVSVKTNNKPTNQQTSQQTNVPFFNYNVKTNDSSNSIFYRWPEKHTLQGNSQIPYYLLKWKDEMKKTSRAKCWSLGRVTFRSIVIQMC